MGEWSEYFEDFPEEDPANYTDGEFDPRAAAAQREAQHKASEKRKIEQQRLNVEVAAIVHQHKNKA